MGREELRLASDEDEQAVLQAFRNAMRCTEQRKADLQRQAELSMKDDSAEGSCTSSRYAPSSSNAGTPVPPYEENQLEGSYPGYTVIAQERPPTPPPKDTVQAGFFL